MVGNRRADGDTVNELAGVAEVKEMNDVIGDLKRLLGAASLKVCLVSCSLVFFSNIFLEMQTCRMLVPAVQVFYVQQDSLRASRPETCSGIYLSTWPSRSQEHAFMRAEVTDSMVPWRGAWPSAHSPSGFVHCMVLWK